MNPTAATHVAEIPVRGELFTLDSHSVIRNEDGDILFDGSAKQCFSINPMDVHLAREIIGVALSAYDHGIKCGKELRSMELRNLLGIPTTPEGNTTPTEPIARFYPPNPGPNF